MSNNDKSASIWSIVFSRRMGLVMLLSFYSGLPLQLTLGTLQAWMKEAQVDLSLIGLITLVGLPYTLKFLWAPLFDRWTLPFLGRRRGWLVVVQLFLVAAIALMSQGRPAEHPEMFALLACCVAFFSASQDILVDALRRESLPDEELGTGSSLYINGYRFGMMVTSAGALVLADHMPWPTVYLFAAALQLTGILPVLWTPEPKPVGAPLRSFREAVIEPFAEYFARPGAIGMLMFILLYKMGDVMASAMTMPFYLDIGFAKTEVAAVVKGFGLIATILGVFAGGVWMLRLGLYRSLWIFGILQALSTAGFALLAYLGHNLVGLAGVIFFENLTAGMGMSAFAAFMARLTNKRFTATQYALLSSLMGVPRVLVSAPTGFLAKDLGWVGFFVLCALAAIPGLLLLKRYRDDMA